MEIINNHTIKVNLSCEPQKKKRGLPKWKRPELVKIAAERKAFLHRKLGGVCMDCKTPTNGKVEMHIHHIFYPLGYSKGWSHQWKYTEEDIFWESYYPEIMEACVLLCGRCHKKRHGIKSNKNAKRRAS